MPPSTGLVVHALHKSASMFLYKFFHELCARLECPLHSIHNVPANDAAIPAGVDHSFVLCPVRSFDCDSYQFSELDQVHHLLQVRDPRDILVSEYFSLGWRHTTENWPEEALQRREKIRSISVDEFVLEELHGKLPLVERYRPILELVDRENVQVVKYETLVTEFPSWLETVLALIDLSDAKLLKRKLLWKYRHEFQPDPSNPGHKRNVLPGDHREKLSAETITMLNERFRPILQRLDYSID